MHSLEVLSHHAYVIAGDSKTRDKLRHILESQHGFVLSGNPDVYERIFDVFSIDDARTLISVHELKPVSEKSKKLFIVQMNGISHEAQNALLKLVEEPSEHSYFFFILPSLHVLLPTIKSRVLMVRDDTNRASPDDAREFLRMNKVNRLEHVKKLIDEIAKEKSTNQDAVRFLNDLELCLYENSGGRGIAKNESNYRLIDECRKYLNDRAPSVKMILEYAALNLEV